MTPLLLLILLAGAGMVLLVAELLLPTHGLLGILGLLGIIAAIGVCFYVNQWLGLAVFLGTAIATPFVFMLAMNLYPRTPVGRRMILRDEVPVPVAPTVRIGQTGVAVTEMRPGGEVDFDDQRLEAISESGMIPAGSRVRVTHLVDGHPRVRQA